MQSTLLLLCLACAACICSGLAQPPPPPPPSFDDDVFLVGCAKRDMTGPVVQVPGMGYGQPSQIMAGLHLRLFARAFVVADPNHPEQRIAFVSQDAGMPSQAQKLEVTKRLAVVFPDGRYTAKNVAISGTHTHSGPSGFFQSALYDLTSMGFTNQTLQAFVGGVVEAIVAADKKAAPGKISLSQGRLDNGANINRSPTSYLENPAAERATYARDGDTDKTFVQLNFADTTGKPLGLLNWFAVHPTSMNYTNHLVSGDHKGTASQFVEQAMGAGALPGHEGFVAAFASTNLGDVSPNTAGPICKSGPAQGQPCNLTWSTCPLKGADGKISQSCLPCYSLGPGKDMFESTRMIARKQSDLAMQLSKAPGNTLLKRGAGGMAVGWAHQWVDMSNHTLLDGSRTCKPALGFAFAGGTTDGPGDMNFHQHVVLGQEPTPDFWYTVRDALEEVLCTTKPTKADYACHAPKPVLLPTGFMDVPWNWHPNIVDTQLFRIGNLLITPVPGELTTMAGRRLRAAVKAAAAAAPTNPLANATVVIAGLSNLYTQYIATEEEYSVQRYEAASTLYGPQTLKAYQEIYSSLVAPVLAGQGAAVPTGPQPPNRVAEHKGITLVPTPGVDGLPTGKKFGDVELQPLVSYSVPATVAGLNKSTVFVQFVGSNPRQSLVHANTSHVKLSGGYLEVQRQGAPGTWVGVANDASVSTKFSWEHISVLEQGASGAGGPGKGASKVRSKFEHLLHMVGRYTGKTVDLAAVQRCVDQGRACDRKSVLVEEEQPALAPALALARPQGILSGHSLITIAWDIALQSGGAQPGTYRIVYHGDAMTEKDVFRGFDGTSNTFTLA